MKSRFEEKLAQQLKDAKIKIKYETKRIPYKISKTAVYIPDFILPNGIIIEAKGYFRSEALYKMRLVKDQHPGLDIRFVFYRAKSKVGRLKMTCAEWADKYGFPWAEQEIPEDWLK